jgi:flagellum-specific ATP synthase
MKALAEQIGDIDAVNIYGRVVGVRGLMVEVAGRSTRCRSVRGS